MSEPQGEHPKDKKEKRGFIVQWMRQYKGGYRKEKIRYPPFFAWAKLLYEYEGVGHGIQIQVGKIFLFLCIKFLEESIL